MKCYYYGPPNCGLPKAVFDLKKRAAFLRYPGAVMMVILWAVLMPTAWLFVLLGNIGHDIAGWCGFDSRDW